MKKQLVIGLLAAFAATPALAALKVGDAAPDFTAAGSLGGKDFNFNLKTALKKGPVVVTPTTTTPSGSGQGTQQQFQKNNNTTTTTSTTSTPPSTPQAKGFQGPPPGWAKL